MEDIFFSRIGLAFQHLLAAVELPAHIQTEVQALSTELQTFEGSINGLIDQRVQARIDLIDGVALGGVNELKANFEALTARVTELEGGVEKLADELDPPPEPVVSAPEPEPAPGTDSEPAPVEAPAPVDPPAEDPAPAEAEAPAGEQGADPA